MKFSQRLLADSVQLEYQITSFLNIVYPKKELLHHINFFSKRAIEKTLDWMQSYFLKDVMKTCLENLFTIFLEKYKLNPEEARIFLIARINLISEDLIHSAGEFSRKEMKDEELQKLIKFKSN